MLREEIHEALKNGTKAEHIIALVKEAEVEVQKEEKAEIINKAVNDVIAALPHNDISGIISAEVQKDFLEAFLLHSKTAHFGRWMSTLDAVRKIGKDV